MIIKSSKLYVTRYIDPQNQDTIAKAYVPTNAVIELMNKNSEIVDEAFSARNEEDKTRDYINSVRGIYSGSEQQNLEAGIQEEIKNAQAAREAYLSGLDTY